MTSETRAQNRPSDDQEQRLRELCEQAFTFLDQLAECRAWNRHLEGKLDTAQAELESARTELDTVRQQLREAQGKEAQGREPGEG
jgi:chromosome segregation ATPase